MQTMNNTPATLPIPNPGDWMTIKAVALLLKVDARTVGRLIERGTLTGYRPYAHPDEKAPVMIWRDEALAVLSARTRLARAATAAAGAAS